jgi:hypothetical protein
VTRVVLLPVSHPSPSVQQLALDLHSQAELYLRLARKGEPANYSGWLKALSLARELAHEIQPAASWSGNS